MPSLSKLTRDQLNDKAEALGVADAVTLKNRRAVIEAIEAKQQLYDGVSPDFFSKGARVLNVYRSRTVIEVSTDLAEYLFEESLIDSASTNVVDAVLEDLALIRQRDPKVADSAIAAAALRMALELENPFTSATSKSMCAKQLQQAMDRLLELSPPGQEQKGRLYDIKQRRNSRRSAA